MAVVAFTAHHVVAALSEPTAPELPDELLAQSIADHGHLLATSSSYQHAMADRHLPDAFATDLTGVYATDPHYGSNLIAIMKLYNLYRYSAPDAQQAAPAHAAPAPRMAASNEAPEIIVSPSR